MGVDNLNYWNERAELALSDETVTHPDIWQRWLEIEKTKTFLNKDQRVVDIGCGSGYATKIYASYVSSILGIDFSAPMIERAQKDSPKNATFEVQDITNVVLNEKFDCAISTRCLINLDSFEKQMLAMSNIHNMLNDKGIFVFVEGVSEGREAVNLLREELGLERMPSVTYNLDFSIEKLTSYLIDKFDIIHQEFFVAYDVISRVLHPLLVAPSAPEYQSKINEYAAKISKNISSSEGASRVIFLILRKK